MADGTFALLTLLLGAADMVTTDCREGACLGRGQTEARAAISAGTVIERRAEAARELYLRYDFPSTLGPFGTAAGFSAGEGGETWIGYGLTYDLRVGESPLYAQLHVMPGFYQAYDGFDLGGPLEFRSGIEIGLESREGWRYAVSYDHRSNAQIYDDNPGIETLQFRVSIPLY